MWHAFVRSPVAWGGLTVESVWVAERVPMVLGSPADVQAYGHAMACVEHWARQQAGGKKALLVCTFNQYNSPGWF